MRFQNSNSKTYFPERVTCCAATVRATALTAAGERTTQFWAEKPLLGKGRGAGWSWPEGPPAPQLELKNHPGSVYFGVLTSAAHQVVHAADQPDDQVLEYGGGEKLGLTTCLLYTSPSPRDQRGSRMPSSA